MNGLMYRCLVLDHDDTVVRSEETVNYPAFLEMLAKFRPGAEPPTIAEFTRWNSGKGYTALCQEGYGLTEEEVAEQYEMWLRYVMTHMPPAFPGIGKLLLRYRAAGGRICVSSHSCRDNILRDYRTLFGFEPDLIFGWELEPEQRKPAPYALDQIRERLGIPYSGMLMVDDLMTGYRMAKSRNVAFAWAGWGRTNVPEIRSCMENQADYCLNRVQELERLLLPD